MRLPWLVRRLHSFLLRSPGQIGANSQPRMKGRRYVPRPSLLISTERALGTGERPKVERTSQIYEARSSVPLSVAESALSTCARGGDEWAGRQGTPEREWDPRQKENSRRREEIRWGIIQKETRTKGIHGARSVTQTEF